MSRYPFSGIELRGQEHPKKFLFVEISVKISENSGTEVSTPLFTIELYDLFFKKNNIFCPVLVCAYLNMKSSVVTYR